MNGLIQPIRGVVISAICFCFVAQVLGQVKGQNQIRRSSENVQRPADAQRDTRSKSPPRGRLPIQRNTKQGGSQGLRVAQRTQPQKSQVPHGFPLRPDQQARIDKILNFWEKKTAGIKTFQCSYQRNEFDPARMSMTRVQGGQEKPANIALGEIRFAEPDKGLMIDNRIYGYAPPKKATDKEYQKLSEAFHQHWVCDGKSIFIRDPSQELLTERRLPAELQGKAISEGPLPFLFGAKAKDMKDRYWVREVTPKDNASGAYYIEATPRRRQDAQNYEKIVIVLQQMKNHKNHLLPVKMRMIYRTIRVNRKAQQAIVLGTRRDEYTFDKHRVNDPRDRAKNFFTKFVQPDVPKNWKKQIVDWNGNPLDQPIAKRPPRTSSQATRARSRLGVK